MLKDRIEAFLQDLAASGKSPKTLAAYQYHLEKFEKFIKRQQIDPLRMNGKGSRKFRNDLVESGLSPASVNAVLAAVKSFYDFLIEEEEIVVSDRYTSLNQDFRLAVQALALEKHHRIRAS